jgi:DNA adenine methylase
MQYLGGKARLGAHIVSAIFTDLSVNIVRLAVDLCSGAGGVTYRLADRATRVIAVETHAGLVAMHKAIQGGWIPPEQVSLEEYRAQRQAPPNDPLSAFIEFGCSFAGKSWGGYARSNGKRWGTSYAQGAKRALLKDTRANIEHVCANALLWLPGDQLPDVVYADPPFEGTTGYRVGAVGGLAWWQKLQTLANLGIPSYLSEYVESPPAGVEARLVWTAPTKEGLRSVGARTERLWRICQAPLA